MQQFILSCGSTIDLSPEHVSKRNIHYIPFKYMLDNQSFDDDLGESFSAENFYNAMTSGCETKTSQINLDDYLSRCTPFLENGQDILFVSLSSGISGAFNGAKVAQEILKEKFPDRTILLVDSLAASSGYGMLMDTLADLRDAGKTIHEVADWLEANKLTVQHWFFSTDLTFYIKGGRVSKTSGFFGKMLNICPLLTVNVDGKLIPKEKVRGKKKVIAQTVAKMETLATNGLNYNGKCYISHSACLEDAKMLAEQIEKKFTKLKEPVLINNIGPTIGSHSGPGTVALFFYGKERID